MISRTVIRTAVAAAVLVLSVPVTFAATQHRVEQDVLASLDGPLKSGGRVTLRDVPVVDGEPQTLVLERFDVLAHDGVIEVHREDGSIDHVKPQPMRQFRGSIEGVPESLVYLSVGPRVEGLIFSKNRKYSISSRRGASRPGARGADEVFIEEIPVQEEVLSAGGYTCAVEGDMITPASPGLPASLTYGGPVSNTFTWPSGQATSMLNMMVDADSAMYANFGNDAATVETYVRNLLGATSTIYHRDLRADLRITLLTIWTSGGGADPFVINPEVSTGTWNGVPGTPHTTYHALAEYGDWVHANRAAVQRSAAMLISGQPEFAGVAWIQTLCSAGGTCSGGNCGDAIFDGHRFGSYSYNGGVGLEGTSVPDPDGGVNYVAPSSNYWSLLQVAHELGHNVQSGHTHCIDTDAGTEGIQPVDACVGGCVTQGSVPAEKGTIMSYCHLRTGGGTNTRYTFGQVGELSEIVLTAMRDRLDLITPTGLSTITAPASLASGATGAASVTNTAGLTFDWTIENGTFTGGGTTATGNAVSFAGTTSPVTLRVTATNSSGCAISDYQTVTITSALAAPTNVQAISSTATAVFVSWSGSDGATSYTVWRSQNGVYTNLGAPAPPAATSFLDETASPNSGYFYQVQAHNGSGSSPLSGSDVATTIVYTDPTLSAGMTLKAVHLTELRSAANLMRQLTGSVVVPTYTDPTITPGVTVIKAEHFQEVETVLRDARTSLGMSVPALLGIADGGAILASDISTLRTYAQ
jgi:hypothetical protein